MFDNEPGNTFWLDSRLGKQWMRLGRGQKLEIEYLNRKGIPYSYHMTTTTHISHLTGYYQ